MSSALDAAAPATPAHLLARNPNLPQHPLGRYTDSQFEAERAQLAAEIQQRYADIVRKLGYVDPQTGAYIPGSVQVEANRQRAEIGNQLGQAREGVTQNMQREGTLFSGYRGTQTARAEHPFVAALANMDVDVPQQMSDLYEQGGGLMGEFKNREAILLAQAAQRAALLPPADPGAGGDGGAGGPGVGDPAAGVMGGKNAAAMGFAPGGGYGYDTGGPLNVTMNKPKLPTPGTAYTGSGVEFARPPVKKTAAQRGFAPGGNYGYNTGGPLKITPLGRKR